MKTKFLRATTKDDLILQGLLYEPESTTNKIVVHIHGMGGNFYENRFLDSMANVYTKNGWAFLPFNTRGHDLIADFPVAGNKEKFKRIGNSREKFAESIYDVGAWLDLVSELGFKEIVLQGHSLGAVKAVYYLGKTGDKRISKLVLASPPDMVALAEVEENHKALLKQSKEMILQGKGESLLPEMIWNWYYLSANTYVDFAKRGGAIDVFNTYDKQAPSILSKIRIPTLAFLGGEDNAMVIPKMEALEILKSKAKNCPVFDIRIVENAPHSYFGHEKEVAMMIKDWIDK